MKPLIGKLLLICILWTQLSSSAVGVNQGVVRLQVSTCQELVDRTLQYQYLPKEVNLEFELLSNISLKDAAIPPGGLKMHHNTTIWAAYGSRKTEIDLRMLIDVFKLDPDVHLTFRNLTLANLATRDDETARFFTLGYPIWAVECERWA
jgi:hypothetical protein